MIIMKFGGTSVADPSAIEQVTRIIRSRLASRPVVVTSALACVTNLLLEITELVASGKRARAGRNLDEIEARHLEVLRSLKLEARMEIEREFLDLMKELRRRFRGLLRSSAANKKTRDTFASFGERFSSWLLTGALRSRGILAERIDSRDIVVTDSQFENAEVDFLKTGQNFRKKILPIVRRGIIPVITGFLGRDSRGNTTTLGRGGSDYSASIAALALGAGEIQIWKDVKGFLTADPRVVKNARVIPKISFREAAELSYFGAKLLHPKTIYPAVERNIPVRVLNTFAPKDPGTLILGKPEHGKLKVGKQTSGKQKAAVNGGLPVRAISFKKGITVILVTAFQIIGIYGFLENLFRIFSSHRIPVDVVATSEAGVSMTIEDKSFSKQLIFDLEKIGTVEVLRSHAILSLVGSGLKEDPRVEERIFQVLRRAKIGTEMISKGASSINFTCIIKEEQCERAVRLLHRKFFNV